MRGCLVVLEIMEYLRNFENLSYISLIFKFGTDYTEGSSSISAIISLQYAYSFCIQVHGWWCLQHLLPNLRDCSKLEISLMVPYNIYYHIFWKVKTCIMITNGYGISIVFDSNSRSNILKPQLNSFAFTGLICTSCCSTEILGF